uniref:Uncharacterized protein n=1 Tax=Ackermannviridae sp. TaxID=2831612 RepID=A0A8S5RU09_9CAUD|nr:MAG TPA: hypothetical protein [Ackermannviridae sp.]
MPWKSNAWQRNCLVRCAKARLGIELNRNGKEMSCRAKAMQRMA